MFNDEKMRRYLMKTMKEVEERRRNMPRPSKPEDVGPDFKDVVDYATGKDGIDLRKIEELEGRYEKVHENRGCDVLSGPCACGAWH